MTKCVFPNMERLPSVFIHVRWASYLVWIYEAVRSGRKGVKSKIWFQENKRHGLLKWPVFFAEVRSLGQKLWAVLQSNMLVWEPAGVRAASSMAGYCRPCCSKRERRDKVLVSGSLFQDRLCKRENFLEVHGIFEVCISAIEARLNYGERWPLNLSSVEKQGVFPVRALVHLPFCIVLAPGNPVW